jgi:uncharacterized protein with gpF-like domain
METVKIKDKRTGAVKTVKKSLASDYVGTGNFEIVKDEKKTYKFALKEEKPEEK